LKIYRCHTQANAIDFINDVVEMSPFRACIIQTDRCHEFQTLFDWHVTGLGMEHVTTKPRVPQLNGKIARNHRTDKDESYQLLTYRDDVGLKKADPSGRSATTTTDRTETTVGNPIRDSSREAIRVKNVRSDL
jgi:transposase InsO family protein